MFLPAAIVLVEGDSDISFIEKMLKLTILDRKVIVACGDGDGGIQNKIHFLESALGPLETSPFRDRLFVVLDKTHSVSKQRLVQKGVREDHITVWTRNGIEYLYPRDVVAALFHCTPTELDSFNIESDPIQINGIRKSKKELAAEVASAITSSSKVDAELASLVSRIRMACEGKNQLAG